MTVVVHKNKTLLRTYALTHLRLVHAALVESYPCHVAHSRMPTNRLLLISGPAPHGSGRVLDETTGVVHPIATGRVLLVPYNHPIEIHIVPDLSFVSWHFNLEVLHGLDAFQQYGRCESMDAPELVREARALMDEDASIATVCRVNEIILRVCREWSPRETEEMRERRVRSRRYRRALDYLREHGDATTTVAALARANGMRADVFSRNFKRDMGVAPKDFLSDILIRRASTLLLAPGTLVKTVARELNFSSEYYFSHFFKRHTGLSPSAFRAQGTGGV